MPSNELRAVLREIVQRQYIQPCTVTHEVQPNRKRSAEKDGRNRWYTWVTVEKHLTKFHFKYLSTL